MTPLETLLILIIWVGYGAFAAYQTEEAEYDPSAKLGLYISFMSAAPLVFVVKALYGAFKKYHDF